MSPHDITDVTVILLRATPAPADMVVRILLILKDYLISLMYFFWKASPVLYPSAIEAEATSF